MKNVLLSAIAIVAFTNVALANTTHKPEKCPSVNALQQSIEFERVGNISDDMWIISGKESRYDTQNGWSLIVSNISANSKTDAIEKAINGLKTLTFQNGPELAIFPDAPPMWYCLYKTAPGYIVSVMMN